MSRRGWRARIAAVCVAAGVLAVLSSSQPAQTEAAWTDAEVAQGTFTAITVPAPVGLDCSYYPGVLNILLGNAKIKWQAPAGYPQYGPANAEYGYTTSSGVVLVGSLGQVLESLVGGISTSSSDGVHTTTVTSLLGLNVFATTKTIAVRFKDPSGWTSAWTTGVGNSATLGSGTCVLGSVPSS